MKKNVITFKSTSGAEYQLTRPTAENRALIHDTLDITEDGKPGNPSSYLLAWAIACLPKTIDIDELPDNEIIEIGVRATELATLGK